MISFTGAQINYYLYQDLPTQGNHLVAEGPEAAVAEEQDVVVEGEEDVEDLVQVAGEDVGVLVLAEGVGVEASVPDEVGGEVSVRVEVVVEDLVRVEVVVEDNEWYSIHPCNTHYEYCLTFKYKFKKLRIHLHFLHTSDRVIYLLKS